MRADEAGEINVSRVRVDAHRAIRASANAEPKLGKAGGAKRFRSSHSRRRKPARRRAWGVSDQFVVGQYAGLARGGCCHAFNHKGRPLKNMFIQRNKRMLPAPRAACDTRQKQHAKENCFRERTMTAYRQRCLMAIAAE